MKKVNFSTRQRRVAITVATIVSIYVGIWLPWIIINIIINVQSNLMVTSSARLITMTLGYIPILTDSIMFVRMSPTLASNVKELRKKWGLKFIL